MKIRIRQFANASRSESDFKRKVRSEDVEANNMFQRQSCRKTKRCPWLKEAPVQWNNAITSASRALLGHEKQVAI